MTIQNHLKQQRHDTPFQPGDKITNGAGVIVLVTRCTKQQAIGFVLFHPDHRFNGNPISVQLNVEHDWVLVSQAFIQREDYASVGDLVGAIVDGEPVDLLVVDVDFARTTYTCVDVKTADTHTLPLMKLSGLLSVNV